MCYDAIVFWLLLVQLESDYDYENQNNSMRFS